jgi:hypothetical protein
VPAATVPADPAPPLDAFDALESLGQPAATTAHGVTTESEFSLDVLIDPEEPDDAGAFAGVDSLAAARVGLELPAGPNDALTVAVRAVSLEEAAYASPFAEPRPIAPALSVDVLRAPTLSVGTLSGVGDARALSSSGRELAEGAAAAAPTTTTGAAPVLSTRVAQLAERLERDSRISEAALLYEVQAVLLGIGR